MQINITFQRCFENSCKNYISHSDLQADHKLLIKRDLDANVCRYVRLNLILSTRGWPASEESKLIFDAIVSIPFT